VKKCENYTRDEHLQKAKLDSIIGQGGKIILFALPSLIAVKWVQTGFPKTAALPESDDYLRVIPYSE